MRKEQADRLKAEVKNLEELTDNLEIQMEIKRRKKYLKKMSLRTIENLENEKMEVIFAQVKRGIKSENLDVTSESVLKMLGALRKEKYVDSKQETSNDVV